MVASPRTQAAAGQPRSDADAIFLARFDRIMRLPLMVSAILPIILAPQVGDTLSLVIEGATWLVFLLDYVVHMRHIEHFGRTGFGRFDLAVVILTAPWYLLPGAHGGGFVVLLRLARLARLLMASKGARQLVERLGRVGIVALGVLVTASLVAYYAEHSTNPQFATVGDALWWGVVTLTTVGYGDIVPKTATGRWAGVVIMITGIAVLGLLAGSLASFLRLDQNDTSSPPAGTPASSPSSEKLADPQGPAQIGALVSEVAALRRQVAALTERIAALGRLPEPDAADPDAGGAGGAEGTGGA